MFKTLVIAVVVSASAAVATAQTKAPPPAPTQTKAPAPIVKQNIKKETATITAIDQKTRSVTLRSADGVLDTFTVGPEVVRFNQLKVGDKITATYQEALVFEVKKPGASGATPGTTASAERYKSAVGGAVGAAHTISVTVKAIDTAAPSITVAAADGRTLTRTVQDRKNLEGVKVGDRIDITYSEALILTADQAK